MCVAWLGSYRNPVALKSFSARKSIAGPPTLGLTWDSQAMRVTNNDQANRYLDPPYRAGWSL